jgi:hypothetical protein
MCEDTHEEPVKIAVIIEDFLKAIDNRGNVVSDGLVEAVGINGSADKRGALAHR